MWMEGGVWMEGRDVDGGRSVERGRVCSGIWKRMGVGVIE